MPLVIDISKCTDTFDDSNNNSFIGTSNNNQSIGFEKQHLQDFNQINQLQFTSNHSDESLANSDLRVVSDDDISEFLVFHKKKRMESDPKLLNGCFVKIKKSERPKTPKWTVTLADTNFRRVTRSKSKLFVKEERPKIVLKFVREKQSKEEKSSYYPCHNVRPLESQIPIKECGVVIEPLQISNPVSMTSRTKKPNIFLSSPLR